MSCRTTGLPPPESGEAPRPLARFEASNQNDLAKIEAKTTSRGATDQALTRAAMMLDFARSASSQAHAAYFSRMAAKFLQAA